LQPGGEYFTWSINARPCDQAPSDGHDVFSIIDFYGPHSSDDLVGTTHKRFIGDKLRELAGQSTGKSNRSSGHSRLDFTDI
jgi:hypothetical protein